MCSFNLWHIDSWTLTFMVCWQNLSSDSGRLEESWEAVGDAWEVVLPFLHKRNKLTWWFWRFWNSATNKLAILIWKIFQRVFNAFGRHSTKPSLVCSAFIRAVAKGGETHQTMGFPPPSQAAPSPQPWCPCSCSFAFPKSLLCNSSLADPGASVAGTLPVLHVNSVLMNKANHSLPVLSKPQNTQPAKQRRLPLFPSILIFFRAICNNSRHNTAKCKCDFQVGVPFRKWISSIFQMSDRCAVKYTLEFTFGD